MRIREFLIDTYAHIPPPAALDALDEESALKRIGPHSVAEIVAHMNFWQRWFLGRCHGSGEAMAATASLGWPAVTSWEQVRTEFLESLNAAAAEADLDRKVEPAIDFPPLAHYTVEDALLHIVVHNAHHIGQIVTLRQLMGKWPPPAGSWTW